MEIIRAQLQHADDVAELFDLYRQFYEQEADLNVAKEFIRQRITQNESMIFVAYENEEAIGFVQLYPSFCSVDACKILILYDLFVSVSHRRKGVGEALMNRARMFAKETGAVRLDLLTAVDNIRGQSLYEKLGYSRVNENLYAYSLQVSP